MDIQAEEQWLWNVAVKKIIVAVIGFIASHGVLVVLQKYGVTVDTQKLQLETTAAGIAAFTSFHDFLKLKIGPKWWL